MRKQEFVFPLGLSYGGMEISNLRGEVRYFFAYNTLNSADRLFRRELLRKSANTHLVVWVKPNMSYIFPVFY